ncbi:MAG TPA: protein kinase, partial [Gemmatimonadales bacterium]|nr:protein kinase [Gemmatimonadales bacterium]
MTDALGRLATALSGRYRLERELGQGGMATVYLAQDLKHDRKVAIKVLRPELAAVIGAERFLTEIKTTANLQHPHILPLHDSGESDGFLFYVMPYVEGESLRDRLNREKQLPINDAVRISVEVAGALDYAHRHNVIHRDIKPENILLHDGRALVADFGIALAASKAGSTRMTETGMSLGTPHYMSPEQAMGEREITARSDVYALGCVTYELLCGEPPFGGPTAQAIVAKVLTEEPRPLLPKRHTIPPHVEAAVLTALEKLPADRFATAAEYAAALNDPTGTAHGPRGTLISRAYPRPRRETMVVRGALAGCLLLGAAAAWGWFRPRPAPPVTTLGLSLTPAPDPNGQVALTPDGERLVYQASGASVGTGRLWVKARGRVEATPLSGTDSAIAFALSPDSKWVAFQRGAHLFKVSLDGGAITPLADSVFGVGTGLAWLDDGTIFFTSSQSGRSRLARIPEAGGPLTELLDLDSIRRVPVLMTPLPGARGVLFAACAVRCSPGDLWVYDAVTRSGKQLVRDAAQGWYLPTGELVYVDHAGQLFAAPFDLKHLELRGTPVPVQ